MLTFFQKAFATFVVMIIIVVVIHGITRQNKT